MPTVDDLTITAINVWPIDVPLADDFVIAKGTVISARNLFVRVRLKGGAVGYGEVAPFPDLTGEDRASSERACHRLSAMLIGQSVAHWRRLSAELAEAALNQPAARCGLETAMLDAFCRAAGLPLWAIWGGGGDRIVETDITIPILSADRSVELARGWYAKGFGVLKLKIGRDLDADLKRIGLIASACPGVSLVLDANQGYELGEALRALREIESMNVNVRMFEQPVAAADIDALARVTEQASFPIAADESVATVGDARRVIRAGAADIINLKIMKSGVLETLAIAALARSSGIGLTIGGMVETRLAMGCSLAIVFGLGGFAGVDLDTPLLMTADPLSGGYTYAGPRISRWTAPGLAMQPIEQP